MKYMLLGCCLLVGLVGSHGQAQEPISSSGEAEAHIPKVLIIGDSISIGYTPALIELLKGEATVVHHKGNAGPTGNGLEKLDEWLGDEHWDLIHFNWGLHDLCYRHPDSKVQGNRDKVRGTLTTSLEQYEQNLKRLVGQLQKTGAKLVWAHTTVVPEGEAGRFVGDDQKYNRVAAKIMHEQSIPINDLCALTQSFPADMFTAPGNVHFTAEGYAKLAEQVAAAIRQELQVQP
jgi:lysophospholipase L1-like esterase